MKELHYKYFKDLYDEESKRTLELHDNAKSNITLVSLYAAFIVLGASKDSSADKYQLTAFAFAVVALYLSIILSLYATRIANFQVPNYPRDVLEKMPGYQSDDDFFEDRVVDLTAAYEWNSAINDRKVDRLAVARLLLILGLFAHFLFYVFKLLNV